jgi:hypothetical protein
VRGSASRALARQRELNPRSIGSSTWPSGTMSSDLPTWVHYLSALGTPIVALMVAVIAFLQWRTAHQHVVLQLFERRAAMIDELLRIVAEIRSQGKVSNEDSDRFNRASKGTGFLFGPEVTTYLGRIYEVLVDLHMYDAERPTFPSISPARRVIVIANSNNMACCGTVRSAHGHLQDCAVAVRTFRRPSSAMPDAWTPVAPVPYPCCRCCALSLS